ncbi:progestin and adipoQ receptor family member 3-like [Ornithodoros turicata]
MMKDLQKLDLFCLLGNEVVQKIWEEISDYLPPPLKAPKGCNDAPAVKSTAALEFPSNQEKREELSSYEDAPPFLQQNPFIRNGYRCNLEIHQCFKSVFKWNNETLNIWTHLGGFLIILGLLIHDVTFRLADVNARPADWFYCIALCVTYMTTLILSVCYHTFNCHSEHSYCCLLKWDVLGVALSLCMTFISGVHYAFGCRPDLEAIYNGIEAAMVIVVLVLNFVPPFAGQRYEPLRLFVLSCLVIFGIAPTAHWMTLNGGFSAPIVTLLLPRIAAMFGFMGVAFLVYKFRFPECFFPGKVDLVGSSHQIWHIVVFLSLVWWHETSFAYFAFMKDKACAIPVVPSLSSEDVILELLS